MPETAPAADSPQCGFTVADLARRWRIGADKIRGFLVRGELVGVNLAANLSARPLWRVTPEAVRQFEQRRTSAPTARPERRRRRQEAIDYYPG